MSDLPVTVGGLLAAAARHRDEAMTALSYLRQLEQLAEATRSLAPEGKIAALAVLDARADALEAVALWRTARAEAARRAQVVGGRR